MIKQELDPQMVATIVGGLIGIAGSVLTLIVGYFIRHTGAVVTILDTFYASPEVDPKRFVFQFEVDLYNSAEIPRSLRNIKIEIKMWKIKEIYELKPYLHEDRSGRITSLDNVNLPPKELKHLVFACKVMPGLRSYGKVSFYMTALYPNGWRFRKHLITRVLEEPEYDDEKD